MPRSRAFSLCEQRICGFCLTLQRKVKRGDKAVGVSVCRCGNARVSIIRFAGCFSLLSGSVGRWRKYSLVAFKPA